MKSSNIRKIAMLCYKARRPFFLWGAPGVGKSDTIRQSAKDIGEYLVALKLISVYTDFHLLDVRATLLDPVDLRGIPSKDGDNSVKWLIPNFLPKDEYGILFLDELNSAPPATQAACYQLILDRRLGDYILPDGWLVIAAGNRETDRAVTFRMPSALANRLIHVLFDVDLNDWVLASLAANKRVEVIAFNRLRPELLHKFDPTRNEKAFPTPRSWWFVSDMLEQNPPEELEFELFKGVVGEGAAAEFCGFLKIMRTLPNPDSVILNPKTAIVPTDPATLYALSGCLSRMASEQNFDRIATYANRLPDEFSVLLVSDATRLTPNVQNTRGYIEWAAKHNNVLI